MYQNLYQNSKLFNLPNNQYTKQFNHSEETVELLIFVKTDKPIESELIEMLNKIIKALHLAENEAEIILFKDMITMTEVTNKYKVNKVLCFACEAEDLNINMELSLFKLYRLSSFQLLLVYDLIDVYNNQKYKATLWSLLQKMFKL